MNFVLFFYASIQTETMSKLVDGLLTNMCKEFLELKIEDNDEDEAFFTAPSSPVEDKNDSKIYLNGYSSFQLSNYS